jgi:hypothetical protein
MEWSSGDPKMKHLKLSHHIRTQNNEGRFHQVLFFLYTQHGCWIWLCNLIERYQRFVGTLIRIFPGFTPSIQAIAGTVLQISSLSLPSTCFPIHYSLIMLPFDGM